jgi:hypothetical protein
MRHPQRRAIFVGDLVDRGPKIVETVTLARRMVAAGEAFCVPGNHDNKLLRYLRGNHVQIAHGLDASIAQIEALPGPERAEWIAAYERFIGGLGSHLIVARPTRGATPPASAPSRSTAYRQVSTMKMGCPSGSTGRRTTQARRQLSMATRLLLSRSGKTIRSTSIPAASLVVG